MKKRLLSLLTAMITLAAVFSFSITAQAVSVSAPAKVRASSASASEVVLKWKKVSAADGYYVYQSSKKKGGYKKIATLKKNSFTSYAVQNLKSGKRYFYKIGAYKGKAVKKSKAAKVRPVPCKIEYLYLVNRDDTAVELYWHYQNGVSGYQIYRSEGIDGDYVFLADTKGCSYRDSNKIDKELRYYYKVRAYTKYKGKTYYGEFSKVKSIKTDIVYWDGVSGDANYDFIYNSKDIFYGYDDDGYLYYHVYGHFYRPVIIRKAVVKTYKKGMNVKFSFRSSEDVKTTIFAKVLDLNLLEIRKEIKYNTLTGVRRVKRYKKNSGHCLTFTNVADFSNKKKKNDYYCLYIGSSGGPLVDYKTRINMSVKASSKDMFYDLIAGRNVPATTMFDNDKRQKGSFYIHSDDGFIYDMGEYV